MICFLPQRKSVHTEQPRKDMNPSTCTPPDSEDISGSLSSDAPVWISSKVAYERTGINELEIAADPSKPLPEEGTFISPLRKMRNWMGYPSSQEEDGAISSMQMLNYHLTTNFHHLA
ncbi:hypothetical protein TIFTF001_050087 [Ficus carica]|uniref:Uncharacterized protein n=1 Tax=Ficus carica TaxID=3494 RepID=A0AA87ZAF2_FICCA|nr:hypothetical protein TIFTF001_050087 [Ficus carica]